MDTYHSIPYYTDFIVKPGQRVRLLSAPYEWRGCDPSVVGEVFEVDEQFYFARGSGNRFKRTPINDRLLLTNRRGGDVTLKGVPAESYIEIERRRKDLSIRVSKAAHLPPLSFVAMKGTGEDFSEDFELQGPDDYSYLSGSHLIPNGQSARIVCPGESPNFHRLESSGGIDPLWHAGDLISSEGTWNFLNPRGETEEGRKVPLNLGDRVMIGREFAEGWQESGFKVKLTNPDGTVTQTVGPRFYGSSIPVDLDFASRRHAVIDIQEEGARITNFSTNGTVLCSKKSGDDFRTARRMRFERVGDGRKYTQEEHPLLLDSQKALNEFLWALGNAQQE